LSVLCRRVGSLFACGDRAGHPAADFILVGSAAEAIERPDSPEALV
jgi:hypothetical protein